MIICSINGDKRELSETCTVECLLRDMDLLGRKLAVEKNGEIITKSRHAKEMMATVMLWKSSPPSGRLSRERTML